MLFDLNPRIEVFVGMGRNVLLEGCIKRVIVRMPTHDRLRDDLRLIVLRPFRRRSLNAQYNVNCEYEEH